MLLFGLQFSLHLYIRHTIRPRHVLPPHGKALIWLSHTHLVVLLFFFWYTRRASLACSACVVCLQSCSWKVQLAIEWCAHILSANILHAKVFSVCTVGGGGGVWYREIKQCESWLYAFCRHQWLGSLLVVRASCDCDSVVEPARHIGKCMFHSERVWLLGETQSQIQHALYIPTFMS